MIHVWSFSLSLLMVVVAIVMINVDVVSAQDGGGGGFGGGGGAFGGEAKFCKPYKCSKGKEAVPKWPLRLTSMGCNGMGGMQVLSAAGAGGGQDKDPQTPCCDFRHACLQTCGSIKTHCDEEFLKCTKATCAAMADAKQRDECDKSAGIHEIMMKLDQCQRYDSEQYAHCECVPKADAIHKREKVLRAFYKKFNPDGIDKVPALAKKADNPRKMAGLLMKLYKKYPQIIRKVKDPQQEMMEKMMRDVKNDDNDDSNKPPVDKGGDSEEEDDGSNAEDLGTDEL